MEGGHAPRSPQGKHLCDNLRERQGGLTGTGTGEGIWQGSGVDGAGTEGCWGRGTGLARPGWGQGAGRGQGQRGVVQDRDSGVDRSGTGVRIGTTGLQGHGQGGGKAGKGKGAGAGGRSTSLSQLFGTQMSTRSHMRAMFGQVQPCTSALLCNFPSPPPRLSMGRKGLHLHRPP